MELTSPKNAILVFGSTGFIGSNVCDVFEENNWLITKGSTLDLDKIEEMRRQVSEFSENNKHNEKFMLQAAWYNTTNDDYRMNDLNFEWIKINSALMELCIEFNIYPYFIGSCLERVTRYLDKYQESKKQSLEILENSFSHKPFGWLRVFYCYSFEYCRPDLIRDAVASIHNREIFNIRNPKVSHDFVHIADVSTAIYIAIKNKLIGLIEIGSGSSTTVGAFIRRNLPQTQISSGENSDSFYPPEEGVADISLLLSYSWQPEKSMKNVRRF